FLTSAFDFTLLAGCPTNQGRIKHRRIPEILFSGKDYNKLLQVNVLNFVYELNYFTICLRERVICELVYCNPAQIQL
ncbi:hypothetical protein Lmac_1567, partial [Legionella maceachernii]